MRATRTIKISAAGMLLLGACGAEDVQGDGFEDLATRSLSLNACEETVPANRYIDGFPAYAQCSAFQAGAIYSNNGIDTSATKSGADWVQTQRDGGYQCTELVHRYWYFKWQVTWLPRGNAGTWCDTQPPANSGVVQTMTPVHGDAIVFAPGSCGASTTAGHVALIDTVDSAKVVVIEQNQARRGTYMQSCAKCFLHLVANDGSDAGSAAKPAPGDAGAGAPVPPVQPDAGRARPDAALPASDAAQAPSQPVVDAQIGTQVPAADAAIRDAGVAVVDASASGGDAAPAAPGALLPGPEEDSQGGCSMQAGNGQTAAAWQLLSALCGLSLLARRASGAHSRRQR